ncbi:hypothetical protein MKW94_004211 [Papaver nudicaule]|uniref:Uncharacterized protein n=1 Tax=Papaver nudicaule TaxID=74823 RepID=A0AA41V0I4_PAPNU|nr:hypothetical protein [Papaver nudicaule]
MQGGTLATTTAEGSLQSSGSGGHHKCSKCNWPYANPHPSAKQRRHHKKVCGKVAGYILVSSTGQEDDDDSNKPLNADNTSTITDNINLNGSDEQPQQQEHQNVENENQIEIKDEEKSNGKGEMGRWFSTKSEEDEFADAITDFTADPLSRTNSIIQQPNDPTDGSQSQSPQVSDKVEVQMENGRKEDLASSSDMPSLVDSSADKSGVMNITEVKHVSETNGDDLVETLSSAVDTLAGKISSEESEIDSNLEKINGIVGREIIPETADATTVLVTDNEAEEAVMDSEASQAKISPSHNEGCIVGEVNEVLVVHPENAHMDVEKPSEVVVEDCDYHELLKPELGVDPDCSKVSVDTELHPNSTEEAHLSSSKSGADTDIIVGEEQVYGVDLRQKEEGSKMTVQEVIVEGQADNSASMDATSNGEESLPDTTNDVLSLSQTEKDETDVPLGAEELHRGQQDQSNNIIPEAHLVVAADADTIPSPSDAINRIMPDDVVCEDEAKVDDTIPSPSDVGNRIMPDDAVCEDEAKVDDPIASPSDAVNCIMPDDAVCEDEAKVGDSSVSTTSPGVVTEENFTNPTEKSPAVAVIPSESVENIIHEERNLDYSGGSGVIHSCDENSEVMVASANDGKVEDTNARNSAGDPSDVHSRSLPVEEGNSILKLSDSLVAGPPDCSVDTNSQTDSVEANWGSVSDGTALSFKDLSDVQGTTTPVSMEAAQGTDPQKISTDRFEPPSITSLVKSTNEPDLKSASEIQSLTTQGEKKDESAKLSSESGKAHSTSLRSLLGSIVESKKKTLNSTTATESAMKANQQKEWDSPARLPVTMHREKRKMKQWVPFMCCSSAVDLKTQS